jgi:hypothetical protein
VLLVGGLLIPALHYWYFLWALPLLACVRLGRRAELILIAFVAALGVAGIADPAVHVGWLTPAAIALLLASTAAAWCGGTWLERSAGTGPVGRRTLGRR